MDHKKKHQKLTGYLLFLEHGFGIVYLTSSIIGVIFCNLGTREEGTLSAYSVFNPNFERLQGTFSSDDFERNVLHRNSSSNIGSNYTILNSRYTYVLS